jgi:hypothetical protein
VHEPANRPAEIRSKSPLMNGSERRRSLKRKRTLFISIILFCLFAILLPFQNCAPNGFRANSNSVGYSDSDALILPEGIPSHDESSGSQVDVIDSVKEGAALSFSTKSIEFHPETQVFLVEGGCPSTQEGAVVGWEVKADGDSRAQSQPIGPSVQTKDNLVKGYANCSHGRFEIQIFPARELECDTDYHIRARLGFAAPGEMKLRRLCASDQLSDMDAPVGP